MRIIKVDMAKKLILKGELEHVKIGKKIHLSRSILIEYLEMNTVKTEILRPFRVLCQKLKVLRIFA